MYELKILFLWERERAFRERLELRYLPETKVVLARNNKS